MSTSDTPGTPAGDLPADASVADIKADIEATRDRLAASVDELAAKADVKGQAKEKIGEARHKAEELTDQARSKAQETAQQAQAGAHDAQQRVAEGTTQAVDAYRGLPLAAQLAIVVAPALLVVLAIIRAIRHR